MGRVWKIILRTERLGGGPLLTEYFLVAINDRYEAVAALRMHRGGMDGEIQVVGEASPQFVEWLDVQPGQIFSVMAVS